MHIDFFDDQKLGNNLAYLPSFPMCLHWKSSDEHQLLHTCVIKDLRRVMYAHMCADLRTKSLIQRIQSKEVRQPVSVIDKVSHRSHVTPNQTHSQSQTSQHELTIGHFIGRCVLSQSKSWKLFPKISSSNSNKSVVVDGWFIVSRYWFNWIHYS